MVPETESEHMEDVRPNQAGIVADDSTDAEAELEINEHGQDGDGKSDTG